VHDAGAYKTAELVAEFQDSAQFFVLI